MRRKLAGVTWPPEMPITNDTRDPPSSEVNVSVPRAASHVRSWVASVPPKAWNRKTADTLHSAN
jgi:hypothetical protein